MSFNPPKTATEKTFIASFKEPRQERSRKRVKLILDAARTILIRDGIIDMKMNEVATIANIPIGSLYQYFPTKTILIAKLFEESLEKNREMTVNLFKDVKSPIQYSKAIYNMLWELHKELVADPIATNVIKQLMNTPEISQLQHRDDDFYTNFFIEKLRTTGTKIPENRLYWRYRALHEMWVNITILSISIPQEEAKELINEAIRIGLRELELPLIKIK